MIVRDKDIVPGVVKVESIDAVGISSPIRAVATESHSFLVCYSLAYRVSIFLCLLLSTLKLVLLQKFVLHLQYCFMLQLLIFSFSDPVISSLILSFHLLHLEIVCFFIITSTRLTEVC